MLAPNIIAQRRFPNHSILQGALAVLTSPADSTTYYAGNGFGTTIAAINRLYSERRGYISTITVEMVTSGTGSAETFSMWLRRNNTTDFLLSNTVTANNFWYTFAAGTTIAVAAGDYFELKFTTPAWVTNPGALYFQLSLGVDNV